MTGIVVTVAAVGGTTGATVAGKTAAGGTTGADGAMAGVMVGKKQVDE